MPMAKQVTGEVDLPCMAGAALGDNGFLLAKPDEDSGPALICFYLYGGL